MIPTARIVHRLRGRLRLKVPAKRRDVNWLGEAASRLEQVPGVERVEVSSVSGSLLIHHHAGSGLEERLAESGLFSLIDAPFSIPPVLDQVSDDFINSDQELERRTGGRVNLRTLAILVLVILAIIQTMRGRIMVPALSLLFFALNLALMAKNPEQNPPL